MNLDEQLKAALNLEAEMRTAPPPDVEGLISGGRARRRRRNAAALAGGLLGVVLLGGGVYGITQIDGDTETKPPVATEPTASQPAPQSYPVTEGSLEPGTYRVLVGNDGSGKQIQADLTFEITGWSTGRFPVLQVDGEYGDAGIRQVERLAGRDYCDPDGSDPGWWATSRTPADTSRELARQFAQLPSSTMIEPITSTRAFGHEAFHLRLRIDDHCGEKGAYKLLDSRTGSIALSFGRSEEAHSYVVVDLQVVDLHGIPVVAYYWHHPDADPGLVAEVTGVRDSISFVSAE